MVGGYWLFHLAVAWVPGPVHVGTAFLRSPVFVVAVATAGAALLAGLNLAAKVTGYGAGWGVFEAASSAETRRITRQKSVQRRKPPEDSGDSPQVPAGCRWCLPNAKQRNQPCLAFVVIGFRCPATESLRPRPVS